MSTAAAPLVKSRPEENALRAFLSLRETTLLAGVPESRVRKDVETGLLSPIRARNSDRLLFRWADVFLFAAIYDTDLMPSSLRRRACERFESMLEPTCRHEFYRLLDADKLATARCEFSRPSRAFTSERMNLDRYLFIDFEMLVDDLAPRMDLYAEGLTRIEEREGVLGGEAVFRGTRLSVRHIGKIYNDGESLENIIKDYPYLRENDIEFAGLFVRAHPTLGRPPASLE